MALKAYDVSRLAWPTDWDSLFGRPAPLYLEIGFGNAEFLVDLARRNPQINIIGVEISLPSIKKAEKKAGRLPAGNVVLVHGDARVLLWGPLQQLLDRIYINFPDPWHKAAHHQRKLINDQFLQLLAARQPAGGELNIATDDPGYQEAIEACLTASPHFSSRQKTVYLASDPARLTTKYEQKAIREGRKPRYYLWERNKIPAASPLNPPQEYAMPHVIMRSGRPLAEIGSGFLPQRCDHFEGVMVRLMHIYRALDPGPDHNEMLLVETHVAEEPMPQRIALFVQARNETEWLIGVHEMGFPRPTAGVHAAVACLAAWLLEQNPSNELVRHNLAVEIPDFSLTNDVSPDL